MLALQGLPDPQHHLTNLSAWALEGLASRVSYVIEMRQGTVNWFEETEPTQKREGDAWDGVEDWRQRRLEELKAVAANGGAGRYGHLREVGLSGYIEAVEKVPREVWVVMHIYDASLGRCAILDSHLSSLARRYPTVKFIRARAGAIGFATSSASSLSPGIGGSQPQTNIRREVPRTKYKDPDESDSDDDAPSNLVGAYPRQDEDDAEEDDVHDWEPEPDYDVLPTMLVYRGGELLFNWPRVDWEIAAAVGKGGGVGGGSNAIDSRDVEALLIKHHIIPLSSAPAGGSSSDLEDEGELEFASDVE